MRLTVLGRLRLLDRREGVVHEIAGALTPKMREVLVYLALHSDGARRDALAEAIWPNSPRNRPYNS